MPFASHHPTQHNRPLRLFKEPGFLNHSEPDSLLHNERERLLQRRRSRALCEQCGRPMSVASIDATGAQLLCSCGGRAFAKRGTKAYREASVRAAR